MSEVFEVAMMLCFGISWPISLAKSIRSKTAKGKSVLFAYFIVAGYLSGLAGKFIAGNVTYVCWFYVLNALMVSCDIVLYYRNCRLDRQREADARKVLRAELPQDAPDPE